MYLCVCKGITEEMAEKAIRRSKGNANEALRQLGVGSDCGICILDSLQSMAQKINQNSHNDKSSPKNLK